MRRYNPFYFIKQAFAGLWRNGVVTFASIAVLMSCLIVIGGFTLLVANIDANLERFGLLNEIVVYCQTDATEEEVNNAVEYYRNQRAKYDEVDREIKKGDFVRLSYTGKIDGQSVAEIAKDMPIFADQSRHGKKPVMKTLLVSKV